MSDGDKNLGSKRNIGDDMGEDDQNVLSLWRDSSSLFDMRYHSKPLLRLVARAMTDDEFRTRLVEDTDAVLAESDGVLADGEELRFYDNSPTLLNVVLPPRAGEMEKRPQALRDALSSLTAEDFTLTLFEDERNFRDKHIKDTVFFPDEP